MTPAERHARRTNAERTATTRTKLLEATVSCLAEIGYAHTSTTEVSRRAGVSRGAQLHHFPTKLELVLAAAEFAVDRHIDEVRAIATNVPEGPDRLDTTIDLLWAIMRGPTFAAPFELAAAARTDPELRSVAAALNDHLDRSFQQVADELFPPSDDEQLRLVAQTVRRFIFSVLYGLALQGFAGDPTSEVNAAGVLMLLKSLCRLIVTAGRVPEVAAILAVLMGEPELDLLRLRDLGFVVGQIDDEASEVLRSENPPGESPREPATEASHPEGTIT